MTKVRNSNLSRRNFLFQGTKTLALLASANVGIYAIGAAFKELNGNLVAGAKTSTCPAGKGPAACPVNLPLSNPGDSLTYEFSECAAAGGNSSGSGMIFDCETPSPSYPAGWHNQAF